MKVEKYTSHHGELLKEFITKNGFNRKGELQKLVEFLELTRQGFYLLYKQSKIKEKYQNKLTEYLKLPSDFFPEIVIDQNSKDFIINLQNKCIKLQEELIDSERKLKQLSYSPKLHPIVIDNDNNDRIAIIPRKAVAGYVKNYFEPEFIAELQTFSLPNFGSGFAFEIEGDSMNEIKHSEFALSDELINNLSEVSFNHIYIVVFKSGDLVCKKIEVLENEIRLISTNKTYLPYIEKTKDVEQIWKVKAKYTPNIYNVI